MLMCGCRMMCLASSRTAVVGSATPGDRPIPPKRSGILGLDRDLHGVPDVVVGIVLHQGHDGQVVELDRRQRVREAAAARAGGVLLSR